jgi:hypothetical protein
MVGAIRPSALSLIVSTLLTVGCSETFHGPPPIITGEGPTMPDPKIRGLAQLFARSAEASYDAPTDPARAGRMLTDGFALIYSNCDEYFRAAGRTQQTLIFERDMLGTLGTLATGIIALAHASKDATAIVALATATGYAVADSITKGFLFSSDNIDAVRELTLRAMRDYSGPVLRDSNNLNYPNTVISLENIQNYCSLRKIAALVKDAIKNAPTTGGRIVPLELQEGG